MKSPFSVVLVLVDGLDQEALSLARFAGGSSPKELRLNRMERTAVVHLHKLVNGRADPAVFSSILATGFEPAAGGVSVDSAGQALPTLLDAAHASGRSTGIVANGDIAARALLPFYANGRAVPSLQEALAQLVDIERADVLFGEVGESVSDGSGRRLLDELRGKDFDVATSMLEVLDRPEWRYPRVVGALPTGAIVPPGASGDPAAATLPKLVRAAIRFLQYNRNGYLLVVHVGRRADGGSTIPELDETLRSVRDFAGSNALVVVCGVPEEGGVPADMLSFAHGQFADAWTGTKSPQDLNKLALGAF